MVTNTGLPQQRPLAHSSAVRSVPSPQHGAHLNRPWTASVPARRPPEEKGFGPQLDD
jgi:hypothetical protein